MSDNGVFLIFFFKFELSTAQPYFSWPLPDSREVPCEALDSVCWWGNPLPGQHGTIILLLLSICLCCTNAALNQNGPNPIYLVQYQFNVGLIPPGFYFHV